MSDLPDAPANNKASSTPTKDAALPSADKATVSQSKRTSSTSATPSIKSSNGFLWLVTVLNLLLVLGLGGAAYWYYMQNQQKADASAQLQQALSQTQQNMQQHKQTLASQFDQVNNNHTALADALNNLQKRAEANEKSVLASTQKLAEMSGRRPSDWLLAEADYLVSMAGRKVYLEQDLTTAITLLQEADFRLEDLNDPSLFPVRALIAADIQALQQVTPVSSSSIALAIAGMLPKVSELPMDTLQLPETEAQQDLTLSDDVGDWQQNLSRTWRAIVGDFISIKQVDAPLEPYLAERQQWLIEQQIKHALSQAQTAALNNNQALFVSAIQQAMTALVEHYKIDDTKVGAFVEALQNLQNTDLRLSLPTRLNAQASLKDIINTRIKQLYNNTPSRAPETVQDGAL
ncbi:MAG: uroporphyrinogen-III C-methyltransferase [Glaciecola sp.]